MSKNLSNKSTSRSLSKIQKIRAARTANIVVRCLDCWDIWVRFTLRIKVLKGWPFGVPKFPGPVKNSGKSRLGKLPRDINIKLHGIHCEALGFCAGSMHHDFFPHARRSIYVHLQASNTKIQVGDEEKGVCNSTYIYIYTHISYMYILYM